MQHFKYWLFMQLICFMLPVSASITDHFNAIKSDPDALYAFFKNMPKGGELHYHLAGGAAAEKMIALATHANYCIDKKTWSVSEPAQPCKQDAPIAQLVKHKEHYNEIIRAWSMKNFIPQNESAHDHFFASFFKFMPLVENFSAQLLADTMQRAANQNELYLEVMILPDNAQSARFSPLANSQALLADKGFQNNVAYTISESRRLLHDTRHVLNCDSLPQQAVCKLTVKFQYIVLREQSLDKLFAQALNGFAAASQSNDIVGINLVQAEDGFISLRDYHAQMKIFEFLHAAYPNVHIALHAGEISPALVPRKELLFHIHDAIFTGHAERIGHGVDIMHENNPIKLLDYMAKKPIPVEINLISNSTILNISGIQHPLRYYLAHHVPVVLSTDDEGVLDTNLTQQFVHAVLDHHLDYPTIKIINRNALTYSFLPGKSLWKNPAKQILVPACHNLFSNRCKTFISNNMKAQLQWELENKLIKFESEWTSSTFQDNVVSLN